MSLFLVKNVEIPSGKWKVADGKSSFTCYFPPATCCPYDAGHGWAEVLQLKWLVNQSKPYRAAHLNSVLFGGSWRRPVRFLRTSIRMREKPGF